MQPLNSMPRRRLGAGAALLLFAGLAIGADQAAKRVLLAVLGRGAEIVVSGNLSLFLVWDRGNSYGLFDGAVEQVLLILVEGAVIGFFAFAGMGIRRTLTGAALGLLLGGQISGLIDRVCFGAKLDYLVLHAGVVSLPSTSFAGLAVQIGFLLVLIDQFFVEGTRHTDPAIRITTSARPRFSYDSQMSFESGARHHACDTKISVSQKFARALDFIVQKTGR